MAERRYLFDTNVLSSLIKQPSGTLASRIVAMDSGEYCTSIIVACELRYGAYKKASPTLSNKVEQLLELIEVLALDEPVDRYYAEVRVALEQIGQPIGHNDLLIAAHTLAYRLILVTDNVREFARVPGLTVENWVDR
jgi:tRNA(fMet)-specific endonuclease VapC